MTFWIYVLKSIVWTQLKISLTIHEHWCHHKFYIQPLKLTLPTLLVPWQYMVHTLHNINQLYQIRDLGVPLNLRVMVLFRTHLVDNSSCSIHHRRDCCEGLQRSTKRGTALLFRALPLRLLSILSLCSHYLRLFSMHALHMLADLELYWNWELNWAE